MKHVRNTGRCLHRWGTRNGFRAGTSDAVKARCLAARIVHLTFFPRTRTPVDFRDDYGRAWSGGSYDTRTLEAQPYTLAMLLGLFDDALRELAFGMGSLDPGDAAAFAATRAFDSIGLLSDGAMKATSPNGRETMVRVYRALATLCEDYTVSGTNEALYTQACDRYTLPIAVMMPVKTSAPWQLCAMSNRVASEAEFNAAPFNTQFLC